ncbi:MAG: 2-amino-4-hydroxy-6-hydroxymethyldihydropteridine diphosphokinase [Armatimonadia bacterium]
MGSNLDPACKVGAALRLLSEQVRLVAVSTFCQTAALGRPEQPDFYNGVVEIDTPLSPDQLKTQVLRPIEHALGRRRTTDRYAARTIDLDVVVYVETLGEEARVQVLDPDLRSRPFLAVPLHELAPDLVLPPDEQPLAWIAASFTHQGMTPLTDFTQELRRRLLPCCDEHKQTFGRVQDGPCESGTTSP